MLVQHLVIVTGGDGERSHHPIVCAPHQIFGKASDILAKTGGVSADVWRGAERLYTLDAHAPG
jgi:hypothetical protein